jgi:hypothetical protein
MSDGIAAQTQSAEKEWAALRLVFLDRLWVGLLAVSIVAVPISVSRFFFTGWVAVYGVHLTFLAVTTSAFVLRRHLNYTVRAVLLIALMDFTAVGGILSFALLGSAWWWMLMGGLLSGLLFTRRIGIVHTVLGILFLVGVAGAYTTGLLTLSFDANVYVTLPVAWATMLSGPALLTICGFSAIGIFFDTARKQLLELDERSEQKRRLIEELEHTLAEVKTLRGLLPICSHCKKIRDDRGYWEGVEAFVARHTDARFTHALCPPCGIELYGDLWRSAMETASKLKPTT